MQYLGIWNQPCQKICLFLSSHNVHHREQMGEWTTLLAKLGSANFPIWVGLLMSATIVLGVWVMHARWMGARDLHIRCRTSVWFPDHEFFITSTLPLWYHTVSTVNCLVPVFLSCVSVVSLFSFFTCSFHILVSSSPFLFPVKLLPVLMQIFVIEVNVIWKGPIFIARTAGVRSVSLLCCMHVSLLSCGRVRRSDIWPGRSLAFHRPSELFFG